MRLRLVGTVGCASFVALGLAVAATPGWAASFNFNSVSDDEIDWADPANWTPNSIPTLSDDATVVSGLLRGAEVHDDRGVNSLVLDSGLNVYRSGSLTVTNGITANAGYFINDGVVVAGVVNNTYISNTHLFSGDVTNNADGAIISEDTGGGNVWNGQVVSNAGWILNSYGTWNGDINSNTGIIDNRNGATWNGNIVNTGEIDSIRSTWNGSVNNKGLLIMSGVLVGQIGNSGSIAIPDSLSGVQSIVNVGNIGLDDGAADDTLSAQSLFDRGTERFDLDTAAGRSDRIILSSYYEGTPTLIFNLVGRSGRVLADIPVIEVGGINRAVPTVEGLPDDGVISYRLVRSGNDWVVAASLSDAPAHVAAVLSETSSALADAARVEPRGAACGRGAWMRGLGAGPLGDSGSSLDFGGMQFGYDLACLPVGSGATLGVGLTMGMADGSVDRPFGGGAVDGDFGGAFGGFYADLVDGAFRAVLQGQAARTQYRLDDPGQRLDAATLTALSTSLGGTARYSLALGGLSLTPEFGLLLSTGSASSADFGDVGAMSLENSPELAAHAGVTLSADLAVGNDLVFTPFASAALHGDLIAPDATFVDGAGNRQGLPGGGPGSYLTVALGADLVHAGTVDAGLRTDLRLDAVSANASLSGHAKVKF